MLKIFIPLSFIITMLTVSHADDQVTTDYNFADLKTGAAILTADDHYFDRMSLAEIAIRMGSTLPNKGIKDIMAQYAANTLEWTEAEKKQITQLVAQNKTRLARISHLLPPQVTFVKVTNKVEGGLPHTRGNAIILPATGEPLSETLFYHELFHVLSRHQAARHDELYSMIGFKPCDFTAQEDVRAKSLTNPDVPAGGYYLPVTIEGKSAGVMTFLHSTREAFDPTIKAGFGGHFGFGLLKVSVEEGACQVEPDSIGKPQILNPAEVPEFFSAIGQNTGYIIHPEEVLADNFVFTMTDKNDLPNPEIPQRLTIWLAAK